MRAWEIIESVESLMERAIQVEVPKGFDPTATHQIAIHKNPSSDGLLGLLNKSSYGNMRGLINGGDVYWWDANDALHAGVANAMGFKPLDGHSEHSEGNDPRRLVLARTGDGKPYLSYSGDHSHPRVSRLLDRVTTE